MWWHRDHEDPSTEVDRAKARRHPGSGPDSSLAPAGNEATTRLLESGRLPAPPSALAPAGNAAVARLTADVAVQRAELGSQGAGPLDPEIAAAIDAERGGGAALPDGIRTEMEGQLGLDLSAVRVHTGQQANTLNRAVSAEAFTTGTDLFFNAGRYDPSSSSGRELLAHELTHVAQQATGTGAADARVSHPDDAAEVEARDVAQRAVRGAPSPEPVPGSRPGTVARRPATGLVARRPEPKPTPGQQTALVVSAQNIIDVVAHDLKTSVKRQETGGKVLAEILMFSVAAVTAAGILAKLTPMDMPKEAKFSETTVNSLAGILFKLAFESVKGIGSKIGTSESVDINTFVDAWVAEQKWGFAVRLHEIWKQQGGNPTELEQALATMATANLGEVRHRLFRGVLAAYMESAQKSKGFWDPGARGLLHVLLRLGGGAVSCRLIGFSGDIQKANAAFERTGVDPLQIGEQGVPVVLTIERPSGGVIDEVLNVALDVASFGQVPRNYRYENYWLHPVGVTQSTGGSPKGGVLAMHTYGQLSNVPANWEAPQVAVTTGDTQSFEVAGSMRDALVWTQLGMKFPIPAGFGDGSGIIGWRTVYR
jgi:hypothetical protein